MYIEDTIQVLMGGFYSSCRQMETGLQKEIQLIQERNKRVEKDKAREVSWTRKICIVVCTYTIMVIFFYATKLNNPWINAIVPTLGFILSTLSLGMVKKIRSKYNA